MLDDGERERLRVLVNEFGMGAAEDLIVAHAAPMVMIALPSQHERDERVALDRIAVGASRFGGPPDLPAGFRWPHLAPDNPMHFHCQLDLASLPSFAGSPLPATGLLYVFFGMGGGDYAVDVRIHYVAAGQKLRRTPRPDTASDDQLSMEYFATEFEPFPLTGAAGIDFAYRTADGDDLMQLLEERLQPADPYALYDRFAELADRAADVHYAERQGSGYPLHWWQVVQLFGATNLSQAKESAIKYLDAAGVASDDLAVGAERARWRRFLSLESNSLIGFETLSDARPYRVLVREQAVPWQSFEHVDTHNENG